MAVTVPSNAIPIMLKWAREKANLTLDDVALAERLSEDRIVAWEQGNETPSLAQLRRLSKRYKRPTMVFYLPEPPKDFNVVKDFRTYGGKGVEKVSPELTFAIRNAQEKQSWAKEYLQDLGSRPVPLVNSISLAKSPAKAAREFREKLGVSIEDQIKAVDSRQAYALWRSRCEQLGIFVFHISHIEDKEMRGCSLPDELAPFVLINSKDSGAPKAFTLLHEVCHILLGDASISGGDSYDFSYAAVPQVERFCNRFAAEVLIPRADFLSAVPSDWRSRDDDVIRFLANRYRVSRAVVALRLVDAGFADKDYISQKWSWLMSAPLKKKQEGGPKQHVLALSRTGESFAKLALSAYHSGTIHGGELSSLLSLKLKHLPALETRLFPSQVQSPAMEG